jgi:pimeloyl-ACP methyl ester carboxylesterase
MFNYNWHPYFGIDEKNRLWEYYKASGMRLEPPDVRIMKFEVIGDVGYIANEFEVRTTMPEDVQHLIDEVQALPPPGETMTDRGRATEIYKRDDGEGRPIWKMWHFHCSSMTPRGRAAASAGVPGGTHCTRSAVAVIEVCQTSPAMRIRGPAGFVSVTVLGPDRSGYQAPHAPVLFLHPVNLTARCWLPVAGLMSDCRRILLDSRGHGRSHMNGPFRIADYAADVRAVIEALALETMHIVGASLGGSIACAVAASMHDRVASLVALGASLEPADSETLMQLEQWQKAGATRQIFDAFLEREISHGLPPSVAAEAYQQIDLECRDPELIKGITLSAFAEDARHYAEGVSCPALVLTGEFDESCPPAAGERMAAALNAIFETLPALGHLSMMQSPALIARKVSQFISGVKPQ